MSSTRSAQEIVQAAIAHLESLDIHVIRTNPIKALHEVEDIIRALTPESRQNHNMLVDLLEGTLTTIKQQANPAYYDQRRLYIARAMLHERLMENFLAYEQYKDARRNHPDFWHAYMYDASLKLTEGKYGEAKYMLDRLRKRQQESLTPLTAKQNEMINNMYQRAQAGLQPLAESNSLKISNIYNVLSDESTLQSEVDIEESENQVEKAPELPEKVYSGSVTFYQRPRCEKPVAETRLQVGLGPNSSN